MGYQAKVHDMVLVVEDEALVRMMGVDMLEDAGYTVVEAASADEALQMLEQNPGIRLVFSDIDMPGSMDGMALADLVHDRWPRIRLLLTSGYHRFAKADLPEEGRFLSKPYSRDAMVDQVSDLLAH